MKIPDHTKKHPKAKKDKEGHCAHCGLEWPDKKLTLEVHLCPRGFYDAAWEYKELKLKEKLDEAALLKKPKKSKPKGKVK